jgi:CBS domain-containing protein
MPIRSLRTILAGQVPVTAPKTATVAEAARLMREHVIGALLVVDNSHLIGIFTERDALFRVLAAGRNCETTRLVDVMTPDPQTIHPDEPFLRALRIMYQGGFRHLPVAEDGRPVGIVSVRDALDDDFYELRADLVQRANPQE